MRNLSESIQLRTTRNDRCLHRWARLRRSPENSLLILSTGIHQSWEPALSSDPWKKTTKTSNKKIWLYKPTPRTCSLRPSLTGLHSRRRALWTGRPREASTRAWIPRSFKKICLSWTRFAKNLLPLRTILSLCLREENQPKFRSLMECLRFSGVI